MENESCLETIDILNREKFIDRVLMVINSCRDQQKNLSFSIEGGWGYGKTFILDQAEKHLADDWIVLRYDSWKYDYYEEPLVALISSISDQLQDHESLAGSDIAKYAASVALRMAWHCAAEAAGPLSFIVKAAGKTYTEFKKNDEEEQKYDSYSSLKKNLDILQELLAKIGEEKPVVLMIDELDRCLPAYQVKVLERIHHVVNGIPCIVVYALNPGQLSETIRQIYGGNDNRVTAYLKKFLDFSLTLDTGMVSPDIEEKHKSDIVAFEHDCGDETKTAESDEWFQKVYTQLLSKLEIRVSEKLWQKRRIIHDIVFPQEVKKMPLIYLTSELMLLAMNEWQTRAQAPSQWSVVGTADGINGLGIGAVIGENFNQDIQAEKLPADVQSFGEMLYHKLERMKVSTNGRDETVIYLLDPDQFTASQCLLAVWLYVNENHILQIQQNSKKIVKSKVDCSKDACEYLKSSMKEFNEVLKLMS